MRYGEEIREAYELLLDAMDKAQIYGAGSWPSMRARRKFDRLVDDIQDRHGKEHAGVMGDVEGLFQYEHSFY